MADQDSPLPDGQHPKKLDVASVQTSLQDADHPWTAQENALTRLAPEDRQRRLGVPLPDQDARAALESRAVQTAAQARGLAAAANLPSAFDLRNVNGVDFSTPVRNQGSCGSCVAFGSVATMKARPGSPAESRALMSICRKPTCSTVAVVRWASPVIPGGCRWAR